jgi:hypothetical protein
MQVQIRLTQAQVRDAAMREQGLSPKTMSMKPGVRVERNRKAMHKRGYAKHKAHAFA